MTYKITLTLTEAQYKGIQSYLRENQMPSDAAWIAAYVKDGYFGMLNNSNDAVNDHIAKFENKNQ